MAATIEDQDYHRPGSGTSRVRVPSQEQGRDHLRLPQRSEENDGRRSEKTTKVARDAPSTWPRHRTPGARGEDEVVNRADRAGRADI